MLELNPFGRIVWNSNTIKTEWQNKLDAMQVLSAKAEYQVVKQGKKQVNVCHVPLHAFDKQIQEITHDKLVSLPLSRSTVCSGFSDKRYTAERFCMSRLVARVVARDLETAQRFVAATEKADYVAIGQLLGYPKCCCEARQSWSNSGILDPCYEGAVKSEGSKIDELGVHVNVHPYVNSLLRYFGVKITPFFPCSFSCNEAIKVGETWLNVLKSIDKETAGVIKDLLEQPISWSLFKGLIYVKTPFFKGVVKGYDCEVRKDIFANQ